MNAAKWVLVALQVVGVLVVIASIGKPRKPIDPSSAIFTLIFAAATVLLVVRA